MDCQLPPCPPRVPSIIDLKKALPAHCFKPSLAKSMMFVLKDFSICIALYVFILKVEMCTLPMAVRYVVFPTYWYIQGTMMWALFVLAHDCGHGSFSNYPWINDLVGNLLNSLILVPYYPWKLSHRHHHKHTGNIDKDEIFYPVREKDYQESKLLKYFGLGIGWFYYLVVGFAPRRASHYHPFHLMFAKDAAKCLFSLSCNFAWVLVLLAYYQSQGLAAFLNHYLVPVFVFASWLVITTFLHHQGENVPWYADEQWDYVKGQLSSVDRHYGWAHELVHNIGTHQVHHLFTKIPHYHLEEATAVFRRDFPDLVRFSDVSILQEFNKRFNIYAREKYIPDDRQLHVFGAEKKMSGGISSLYVVGDD